MKDNLPPGGNAWDDNEAEEDRLQREEEYREESDMDDNSDDKQDEVDQNYKEQGLRQLA